MQLIQYLSTLLVPLTIFYIVLYGILAKTNVLESFTTGAKQGLGVVYQIAPTVLAMFMAIGIFRSSGAFDLLCGLLSPITSWLSIPEPLIPLAVIKSLSSSGANSLLFDLYKAYGTDSFIGFSASILLCCTETLFYTVSVYYMKIGITKTRWTIPASLIVSLFSFFTSLLIAKCFLPL